MHKIITAALALSVALPVAAIPTIASAQSRHEVRESQRDLRHEQRQLRDAERRGDRGDIRRERRDVRDARREVREDWRDYRNSHRNDFRRPAYAGPRGYRYSQIGVGHRFDRPYLTNRYWVNDYARYRLAAPGAGLRWIRYGNDVALVNIRTGRVITVHHSFFW